MDFSLKCRLVVFFSCLTLSGLVRIFKMWGNCGEIYACAKFIAYHLNTLN